MVENSCFWVFRSDKLKENRKYSKKGIGMKKKVGMLLGFLCVGYGSVTAGELDIIEEMYVMPAAPTAESPSLKQKILKFISLPKPKTGQGRMDQLKELGQFLLKNKGCLSGEGCSVRTTFAMNYLLGVAVELALYAMIEVSRGGDILDETAPVGSTILATLLIDQAISLGYEHVIDKSELSYFACVNVRKCSICLISGKNCNVATRRKLFFHAGRWSTILTSRVINIIRASFARKKPEELEQEELVEKERFIEW